MKPIKKGITEAVTRDGRKVTQLTWFDVKKGEYCIAGVLQGEICTWTENGRFYDVDNATEHEQDIFAPVEYEWQWLVKNQFDGKFHTTKFFKTEESLKNSDRKFNPFEWCVFYRIEESKREVQE